MIEEILLYYNMIIREINESDYNKGFLNLFQQLNNTEIKMSFEKFKNKLLKMNSSKIIVVEFNNFIIATGKVYIEEKFYNNVAHIEDIIVHKNFRKIGLGKKIVKKLIDYAHEQKCYKVILNCKEEIVKFYKSNNFKIVGTEMGIYF